MHGFDLSRQAETAWMYYTTDITPLASLVMLPEEDLSIDLKRFSSGDSSPPITCWKVSLPSPSKSISSKIEETSSLK